MLKKKKIIIAVIVLILITLIAVGTYFFFKHQRNQTLIKNPTYDAQMESKTLIEDVARKVSVPKDEKPTIATISDVEELKGQEFFVKAKNGYKVLMYSKAQVRVLYDPEAGKIIEVERKNP